MRDLERLLTGAYPEGLRDVPPRPGAEKRCPGQDL